MTKIIGILNLTLDSFSDGGMYYDLKSAKKHIAEMVDHGADVIDVGAESTRSGFTDVDEDTQIKTLLPVIEYMSEHSDVELSIDTRSSKVAARFKSNNISYINDVSSGTHDDNMCDVVSSLGCKFIITHMPSEHKVGSIKKFDNILDEIKRYFSERIEVCIKSGINEENIIIDPGVGFGKSGADNMTLLTNIKYLQNIHKHVCIGSSNKRFSSKLFEEVRTKDDMKIANLACFTASRLSNVSFLRVHDVGLTNDAVKIIDKAKSLM